MYVHFWFLHYSLYKHMDEFLDPPCVCGYAAMHVDRNQPIPSVCDKA